MANKKRQTKKQRLALAAERLRNWRAANRDEVNRKQREYLAGWREENPDKLEAYAITAKKKRDKAKRLAKREAAK